MDISFTCKNCGQKLEIDESGAGMKMPCPTCQNLLAIPHPKKIKPWDPTHAISLYTAIVGAILSGAIPASIYIGNYSYSSKFDMGVPFAFLLCGFLIGFLVFSGLADLVAYVINKNKLHAAIDSGCVDSIRALLARGAKGRNKGGHTPLHHAALKGNLDVIEILIKVDPQDVFVEDMNGARPSKLASEQGHKETAKVLLAKEKYLEEEAAARAKRRAEAEEDAKIPRYVCPKCEHVFKRQGDRCPRCGQLVWFREIK